MKTQGFQHQVYFFNVNKMLNNQGFLYSYVREYQKIVAFWKTAFYILLFHSKAGSFL